MKKINSQTKQKGFFSVGIAAIVLLVSGGVITVTESNENNVKNIPSEQVQSITEGEFEYSRTMTPEKVMGLDNLYAL